MSMIRPSEHAREIISNDYEQKHSGESIDSDRTNAINMETAIWKLSEDTKNRQTTDMSGTADIAEHLCFNECRSTDQCERETKSKSRFENRGGATTQ